jgi:hypothetical protein
LSPHPTESGPLPRVMAAFSGSHKSVECVRAAASVCQLEGSELIVAWVLDLTWNMSFDQPLALGVQALTGDREAQDVERIVAEALEDAGCRWRLLTCVGHPGAGLNKIAQEHDVRTVFVGPTGRFARWAGRSVPRDLKALAPMLTIRAV